MHAARSPFQYALLRVVPHLERGERFNAGVVLFCRPLRFLDGRCELDGRRLEALAPGVDPQLVRRHLEALVRIARGEPDAGPVAALPQSERFSWIVAPSSTIVQPSAVHTGLTADPQALLEHLHATLVLPLAPAR